MVARAIHHSGRRAAHPFLAVNCSALPGTLIESLIFGHQRGAFTGAIQRIRGQLELAGEGTLLLDEIAEMPVELQAKLLRVLEQREVERLGGSRPIPIDVRFVAATHRALDQLVAAGRFREDLYYRLNVFPLRVPPLRERSEDVPQLLRAFAAELLGPSAQLTLTPEAEALLRGYRWPGNVRELRNLVERLVLLHAEGGALRVDPHALAVLTPGQVMTPAPTAALPGLGERPYRELVEAFERQLLEQALAQSGGNVAAAARLLKADRGNLYRRMKALGLSLGEPEAAE
jgi:transcriptional regulator with GAF, ATPase, and Fis domain